jgi:hypothetical protein
MQVSLAMEAALGPSFAQVIMAWGIPLCRTCNAFFRQTNRVCFLLPPAPPPDFPLVWFGKLQFVVLVAWQTKYCASSWFGKKKFVVPCGSGYPGFKNLEKFSGTEKFGGKDSKSSLFPFA